MASRSKKKNKAKNLSPSLKAAKDNSVKKNDKKGWFKRFMDWIAEGTETSSSGRSSCPT